MPMASGYAGAGAAAAAFEAGCEDYCEREVDELRPRQRQGTSPGGTTMRSAATSAVGSASPRHGSDCPVGRRPFYLQETP
jgi:hypothetical protein